MMPMEQSREHRITDNPVTRKLLVAIAGGAMLLTAGCSSSETGASAKPETTVTSEYRTPSSSEATDSNVTKPVEVEGDGNPANDQESSDMAQYYADNLRMEDSDAMQARIDDPTIAGESRTAVDKEEAEWAQYYADNGRTQEAQDMKARVGK